MRQIFLLVMSLARLWPRHILQFRNIVAKARHLHFYVPLTLWYTFIPLSSNFSIVWFFFLLFFYILQLTTILYSTTTTAELVPHWFSPSRCPPQPRFRSRPRSRARSSFSCPFSVSQLVSCPYFNLATRRFHPHPPSVLESIRNPTAASRHITPQLAQGFCFVFRHGQRSVSPSLGTEEIYERYQRFVSILVDILTHSF